jgi:hypothetical protein
MMNGDQGDPHRPFEDIARDLSRRHRDGRRRTPRQSRLRTPAEAERRARLRWVLAIVLGLGLAIAVAFAIPT